MPCVFFSPFEVFFRFAWCVFLSLSLSRSLYSLLYLDRILLLYTDIVCYRSNGTLAIGEYTVLRHENEMHTNEKTKHTV